MKNKYCKICKSQLEGRSDKIFCSIKCKNYYHKKLRRITKIAAKNADKILHRNRSILFEIMGNKSTLKVVARIMLDQKKFNYNYETGRYINPHSRVYHRVYDFSWLEFSDQEILILRTKSQDINSLN